MLTVDLNPLFLEILGIVKGIVVGLASGGMEDGLTIEETTDLISEGGYVVGVVGIFLNDTLYMEVETRPGVSRITSPLLHV